jgi:hypothetical protein
MPSWWVPRTCASAVRSHDQCLAMKGAWPHLRGLLVALHVIAVLLMAFPAPGGGMNRSAWKDPTVKAELSIWQERLAGLGIGEGWTYDEFEQELWDFARAFTGARASVLAPFEPYHRWCGTRQSWRMFVAPHMHPARLVIRVRAADTGGGTEGWTVVYRQLDGDANWQEKSFESDRFRSVLFRYPWKAYRRSWAQLSLWIRDRAAEDFPSATHVDMAWHKARTPTPAERQAGVQPAVTVLHRKIHALQGTPKNGAAR